MRLAFFGDVVGKAGRRTVERHLPDLRKSLALDAVVMNGENAAAGFGITRATAQQLFDAGVDVITLGNHSFDNASGLGLIEEEARIIRPCNYPKGVAPWMILSKRWKQSSPPRLWGTSLMRSLSISTPKPRQRKTPWACFAMAAPALWWEPISIFLPPIRVSCLRGPLTKPMRACAAIMTAL